MQCCLRPDPLSPFTFTKVFPQTEAEASGEDASARVAIDNGPKGKGERPNGDET